jgi:hypothetical protein
MVESTSVGSPRQTAPATRSSTTHYIRRRVIQPAYGPYAVLDLTELGRGSLVEASYLAEYDAIVLEPCWLLLSLPSDGEAQLVDHEDLLKFVEAANRHGDEFNDFYKNGGILFVLLDEPCLISSEGLLGNRLDVHSYGWWLSSIQRRLPSSAFDTTVRVTRGTSIVIREPGHPLEDYLRLVSSYPLQIRPQALRLEDVILATDRIGNPIAVEMPMEQGAIILVPPEPGTTAAELNKGIMATLNRRLGPATRWHLTRERALQQELDDLVRASRDNREEIESRLGLVRANKVKLLAIPAIERILRYHEKAIESTPTPFKSLQELHKMVEAIEHRLGGDAHAARMLQLTSADFRRIKRLASDPVYDVRPTVQDSTDCADSAQFDRALGTASTMVERLLELEYSRMLAATPD